MRSPGERWPSPACHRIEMHVGQGFDALPRAFPRRNGYAAVSIQLQHLIGGVNPTRVRLLGAGVDLSASTFRPLFDHHYVTRDGIDERSAPRVKIDIANQSAGKNEK